MASQAKQTSMIVNALDPRPVPTYCAYPKNAPYYGLYCGQNCGFDCGSIM